MSSTQYVEHISKIEREREKDKDKNQKRKCGEKEGEEEYNF